MEVLVVGGDGRAHALTWRLALSDSVETLAAAPGNPGIAAMGIGCLPVDPKNPADVAQVADDLDVDLVVVSPEEPLVNGVVDAVQSRGRSAFGPTADGARLEGSKAWMKEVVADAGVPTATHGVFSVDDEDAALAFLEELPGLYVVKTDGLAAGKGVVVTESIDEARDAVRRYLSGEAFGDAGRTLVIEEGLTGPELSLLVVCNGREGWPLAPAQDFKRIGDGDTGPNTGGMGAYSPVPFVGPDVVDEVMATAVRPTLAALKARGIDYRGVLYAGLMLTPDGPKLLEYNVRFGDPEAQVVLPRLAGDVGQLCYDAATGADVDPQFSDDACVTVVLATEGYPTSPRSGDVIEGIDAAEELPGVTVFHAGTARRDGEFVTAGGRVVDVTALAPTLADARARAYEAAGRITWPGVQYRRDIAEAATTAAVDS
ncbi:MAG TPA: phosphoribosylamine--glycine ligase [Acidimicrobiia bacterium]|nr:phosphoribosylamine--glycine ligase [Acidimicrobiia bacterium]